LRRGNLRISFNLKKDVIALESNGIKDSTNDDDRFNHRWRENHLWVCIPIKFDFYLAFNGNNERHKFCALFQFLPPFEVINDINEFTPIVVDIIFPLANGGNYRQDETMLFNIREISNFPHRSACGRAMIWLISFDDFQKFCRDIRQTTAGLSPVILPTSSQREGDTHLFVKSHAIFATYESPSQVIEGASEVMDDITELHPDIFAKRGCFKNIHGVFSPPPFVDSSNRVGIRIGLHSHSESILGWVEGFGDVLIKLVKLTTCPIELVEGIIQRMHMLYYPNGEENGKETKDSKGARNTRAHKRRVPRKPQKGNQDITSKPEEVKPQTLPDHHCGDCNAKNTHSGSLEDV